MHRDSTLDFSPALSFRSVAVNVFHHLGRDPVQAHIIAHNVTADGSDQSLILLQDLIMHIQIDCCRTTSWFIARQPALSLMSHMTSHTHHTYSTCRIQLTIRLTPFSHRELPIRSRRPTSLVEVVTEPSLDSSNQAVASVACRWLSSAHRQGSSPSPQRSRLTTQRQDTSHHHNSITIFMSLAC